MKWYFTYGSNGADMPYVGGWTVIEASTYARACTVFRLFHPDRVEGIMNCSWVYSEDTFMRTDMYKNGNFGAREHEVITLTREAIGDTAVNGPKRPLQGGKSNG